MDRVGENTIFNIECNDMHNYIIISLKFEMVYQEQSLKS